MEAARVVLGELRQLSGFDLGLITWSTANLPPRQVLNITLSHITLRYVKMQVILSEGVC